MINRWTVLAGCLIALTVSFAPAYLFTYGIFLKAMVAEFHWSRTQASTGFSVAVLAAMLTGTPSGFWIDRSGNRIVVITAAVLLPLALASMALVSSFAGFVVAAAAVGIVGGASNPASVMSLLPQWFDKRLGMSLAIAAIGTGIGGALMAPAAERFLQSFGWRGAFVAVAVVIAVIGVVNALVLVHDNPDFLAARRTRARRPTEAETSGDVAFGEAISSRLFWQIAISFALVCMVYWGVATHLPAIMTDRGYSPVEAAAAVSLSGIGAVVARLGCGVLLDYVSANLVGFVFFAAEAGACVLLAAGLPGIVPYVAGFLFGAALGAESDIMAFTLRRRFGMQAHARIYGFCFALFNGGALVGPLLMGATYDNLGSYKVAILSFAVLALIAAVMFGTARAQAPVARLQLAPAGAPRRGD